MNMEYEFHDFKEEPWLVVDRLEIEVYFVGDEMPFQFEQEWMAKKMVTVPEIQELSILYGDIYLNTPIGEEPSIVMELTDQYDHLLIAMRVRRIYCKAGIVLKTVDDICEHFFPEYNKQIEEEESRKFARMMSKINLPWFRWE